MPWNVLEIPLALPAFALVMFRIGGLMLTAPIFASRSIPVRVRVGLVVALAAMIYPMAARQVPPSVELGSAIVGGVGELMIGAIIGLSLSILLLGAEVGGLIVGRQAGLALANVFDPTRNQQSTTTGQVYSIALTTLFLLAGGHRATVAALLDTFDMIPLLSFRVDESFVVLLVEMLASAFILGIRIAGPVLIALFLLGTTLGFLSRTMPQFNILTIGFALRTLLALGIAALAFSATETLFLDSIWDGVELVRATFGLDPVNTRLVT